LHMTRIAEPILLESENRVDVHYEVIIRDKKSNHVRLIEETHRMRYLFKPEIELILNSAGFTLCDCREWLGTCAPNLDSWSVVCLARKQQV
jgi:hypothetical protein